MIEQSSYQNANKFTCENQTESESTTDGPLCLQQLREIGMTAGCVTLGT
jgi:hypothetical protein